MIEWLEAHPALAGWAQALGALVTLWVAFAIPTLQRGLAQRDAETALGPVVHTALDALHDCYLWNEEKYVATEKRANLAASIAAVNAFPATSLKPKLIQPFMQFRATCEILQTKFLEEARTKEQFAPLKAVSDAMISMYLKSVLEYTQQMKRHAPKLFLSDSLEELENTLYTEDRADKNSEEAA